MADDVSAYSAHAFVPGLRNNSWSNLFDLVPDGSRVLDVGCSTGNLGAALASLKECAVVGVDVNAADIDIARTVLTEAYVLDLTAGIPTDLLGYFDVVVFADVLEHVADPRGALRAIHSVLNPGARIVYSIPNMGHTSVRLDLLAGRFSYTETGILDKTHLHFYDRDEVASLLSDGGFVVTDEDPVIVEYPKLMLTEKLSELGLAPDERFFDSLRQTDAHVFQFVGSAVPSAEVPDVDAPARQREMPTDEILDRMAALVAENNALEARLTELMGTIALARRHPLRFVVGRFKRRFSRGEHSH